MRIIVINKEIVFAYLGDEAFNIGTGYAVILLIFKSPFRLLFVYVYIYTIIK